MLGRIRVVTGLCTLVLATQVHAQNYPNRPIRVIVGPSPDAITRIFAEKMQTSLGQPVIVEPRPGAGGDIAAKVVSGSAPDGYTLLFATSSFTLNTALHLANYDFLRDFEPVAPANVSSFVLVVNPSLPVRSLQDLIAMAKSKPGELTCASAGHGTPPHLACEMFNKLADVKTVHVPFRDANAAMGALLGGHVSFLFAVSASARGQIGAGSARALAVSTAKPSALFPGLPTVIEAGLPGFEVTGWGAFMAPAGTPELVVDKLNKEILRELKDDDIMQKLAKMGLEVPPLYSPTGLGKFIKEDIGRWNRIIDMTDVGRGTK
jgi:tripartite-type tricarboxylate transporter receptor subunit TctC